MRPIALLLLIPSLLFASLLSPQTMADDGGIYAQTNAFRAQAGLASLAWDSTLAAQAQAHANRMAASGSMFHSSGGFGGENVAVYGSPTACFGGWCNSSGHRANMLGGFSRVGIGVAYRGRSCFACQQFAGSGPVRRVVANTTSRVSQRFSSRGRFLPRWFRR